jgi:hypothetical protein
MRVTKTQDQPIIIFEQIRRKRENRIIQLDSRFLDFKVNEKCFNLFLIPFSLSIENVLENMQMG